MKTPSLARAATAAALVLALLHAPAAAKAAKSDCTDAAFATEYGAIRSQMSTCEAASGTKMDLPLKKKKRVVFCTKCPDMYALEKAQTLPNCNVTTSNGEEIKLQKLFNKLFSECTGTSADSESDSGSGSVSSGSGSTTITKTPTTTTKTPKSTQSATSGTTSSSSGNSTSTQTEAKADDSSSLGIGAIVGIIVGALAVVLAVAFFIVRWRRRNHDDNGSEKAFDAISMLQAPTTGQASTAPYQFSFITNSTGDSKGKPSSVETPLANL
ncbi:Tkl protein kinase, partial [Globisporangium polare]